MQKGHVKNFHGRLRDECLNASWFHTLNDVRRTLDNRRQEYNCARPHSALAYRSSAKSRNALGYGDVVSKQRSHVLAAPTTTATDPTRQQTETESLQLSLAEKNGVGQIFFILSSRSEYERTAIVTSKV